jgi:3-dehydroquinate synthetase
MVDAAIGGKTGINLDTGKNLVGSFWQPAFVLADPEVLSTLPVRERRAAFGELVKYALLDGEELFGAVDQLAPALGREPASSDAAEGGGSEPAEMPPELARVIRRCAAIKAWIVSRDECERTGERALLNLGHTVGHAIETASGYGPILHGEAVALGLLAACRVSARSGLCDSALETRVEKTLAKAGLDTGLDAWLGTSDEASGSPPGDGVLSHIGVDKKRTGRSIDFVAIRDVGSPTLIELDLDDLVRILHH